MARLYQDGDNQFSVLSYRRGYAGGGIIDFNRGFAPKPVQVGKEYVDMTDISRQGDSIARVQGRQKVKIRVNQVGNRFATAAIVS